MVLKKFVTFFRSFGWGLIMDRKVVQWLGVVIAIAMLVFGLWWFWPPAANPDSATVDAGSIAKNIDVLANDTDLFHRRMILKEWSQGANGGAVALTEGGTQLAYTTPLDRNVASDSFTYTIWSGHGFSSTATVNVTIRTALPPAALNNASGDIGQCPRGREHSANAATPLPQNFGNCTAVYFAWLESRVGFEHAKDVRRALRRIAAIATGKHVLVAGYTDTSGVNHLELSKKRACSAVKELHAFGMKAASVSVSARGAKDLAVTTDVGVKEPLNRRVEITIAADPFSPGQIEDTAQCPQ